MGEVVNMADHKITPVKPKSEARTYKGHRYILTYNPDAAVISKWSWHLKFTRVYEFSGSCPTIEAASKAAQKQVESMEGRRENGIRA